MKEKTKVKMKVKKSVRKRFKVTKTGKVLRGRQYGRHLKIHKSKSIIRRYKVPAKLRGKVAKKIKKMLGYA